MTEPVVPPDLAEWRYDPARRALYRRLVFRDFSECFAMMVRIAMAAEQANHHPEWSNVYNRLDIWLTTHDSGAVGPRDFALARAIDRLLAQGARTPA